jgi:hypothetical protein
MLCGNRSMEELDLAQPAIVFWMHHPGGITRFDRLGDAVQSVMQTRSAKTAPVAWIKARDRHIEMDEIRQIAQRFGLTWRLSQVAQAASDTADAKSKVGPTKKRFWWPEPEVLQS